MTPQELIMSVQIATQQVKDLVERLSDVEHRLALFERRERGVSKPASSGVAPQRPTQNELLVVDRALAEVVRETGLGALEILHGGRGACLVEARRKVALRAQAAGLSDGAIGRAMGFERSTISHLLRAGEGK